VHRKLTKDNTSIIVEPYGDGRMLFMLLIMNRSALSQHREELP
jgi:hypothetical protein